MTNNACPIEHIIVVMLENRSYDNVLGGLYLPTNSPPYNQAPPGQADLEGLADIVNNSPPTVANQTTPTQIQTSPPSASYPPTTIPLIDPGELFEDMAQQILGTDSTPPLNPYDPAAKQYPPSAQDAMQGFMKNYAGLKSPPDNDNLPVPDGNLADVMNYFTPEQVPVTAWLATNFAVCDQWFASVPTQTFTNRAFAHGASPAVTSDLSGSLIDDSQYVEELYEQPSIFSQLDAVYGNPSEASPLGPPNWKVYFHDYSISMLTVPYVMNKATSKDEAPNVNVATYDDSDWLTSSPTIPNPVTWIGPIQQTPLTAAPTTFLEDVANQTLPKYSFIEPRYSNGVVYDASSPTPTHITPNPNTYPPNSNHPGAANYPYFGLDVSQIGASPVSPDNPPIDVADGEAFLMDIYNALCQSDYYWNKCLLVITYDEHGGLYDHVLPPPVPASAVPPDAAIPPVSGSLSANGFNFNVYGCRVPAIIVSPYIAPGTTIRSLASPPDEFQFDHASIVKTVWDCFNLSTTSPPVNSLTYRDLYAPSLLDHLTSSPDNNPGPYPGSPPL